MHWRVLTCSAVLMLGGCEASDDSRRIPDPNFIPVVNTPRYPAGDGPTVLVDTAHGNFHTAENRYRPFAQLLRADGYIVADAAAEVYRSKLMDARVQPARSVVLVIANAAEPIAADRAEAILAWVRAGGALLLIVDHPPHSLPAIELLSRLGLEPTGHGVWQPGLADPPDQAGKHKQYTFRPHAGLSDHPITTGFEPGQAVAFVTTFFGVGLWIRNPPADAQLTPVLSFADGVYWLDQAEQRHSAAGSHQGIAIELGRGRVYVSGEARAFTALIDKTEPATSAAGMQVKHAEHNAQFLRNVIYWLTEPATAPAATTQQAPLS